MTTEKRRPAATGPPHTLSGQLRAAIHASGLTLYAVARTAAVAPSVVSRFVKGERGLTLGSFDRIGAALGLGLVKTTPADFGRPDDNAPEEATCHR